MCRRGGLSGYVSDVILTRDPWMHRLDSPAQPVGTWYSPPSTTASSSQTSWPSGPTRHGQPYRLELTGPAGGAWSADTSGEEIVMDAADFCRILAGRPSPDGQPSGLPGH